MPAPPVFPPGDRLRRALVREALLDAGLVLAGILVLPVAVYFVGRTVFGDYAGSGFGAFFGELTGRLGDGNPAAWFLVLAPLFAVLFVRAVAWGWRAFGRTTG